METEPNLNPSNAAAVNTPVPPEYVSILKAHFHEMAAEIERLRARVLELEAELAATRGTLARSPEPAPFTVTDAPTTTPR